MLNYTCLVKRMSKKEVESELKKKTIHKRNDMFDQ